MAGSLLNVIFMFLRNVFIPLRSVVGALATPVVPGSPVNIMSLSAMKSWATTSCSTTNAVAFRVSMTRLIVRAMARRSSTSRYALGSSSRYSCAFLERQAAMAMRCSSPPLS